MPTSYHQPKTVDELTAQNVASIIDLERAARVHGSWADKAADGIAHFCGSFSFAAVHFVFFAAWIVATTLWLDTPFDPYPFTFLTLVVSLEAIFLTTFILIGETRQQRIAERRTHLDLQINLLTEQENTKTLVLLEKIAQKMGIEASDDPDIEVLEQATHPGKLIEQIDKTAGGISRQREASVTDTSRQVG